MFNWVIISLKTAGFSAASDATRVSVIIGVFKVFIHCTLNLSSEKGKGVGIAHDKTLFYLCFIYAPAVADDRNCCTKS